jgi:hypothetical protein
MEIFADHADTANQSTEEPEEQVLFLPSDFPDAKLRHQFNMDHLASIEIQLREGEAYDAIRDVRLAVKHINGLTYQKQMGIRHSGPNTRAKEMIDDVKRKRDGHIDKYDAARQAMINLGCTRVGDKDEFPKLTVADAAMPHTERPHALGDGSKSMAMIWRVGGKRKVLLKKDKGGNATSIFFFGIINALFNTLNR